MPAAVRPAAERVRAESVLEVAGLLALREEPLLHLRELTQAIRNKKESLPPEDRERVSVLDQGAAPQGEEETTYHSQAGSARRLLERVIEVDRRLNRRLAGDASFYGKDGR